MNDRMHAGPYCEGVRYFTSCGIWAEDNAWEAPDFLDVSLGIAEGNGVPLCPTCQRDTNALYLSGEWGPVEVQE